MARPLRYPFKKLVSFDQEVLDAIEKWRRGHSPIPSEADAIRFITRDWLVGHGLLAPEPEGEEGEPAPLTPDHVRRVISDLEASGEIRPARAKRKLQLD